MQGYSNSIVCKMIQNHTKLFVSEVRIYMHMQINDV